MSGVDAMALFLQVERARARGDWVWLQAAGAGAEAGLRPAQAALASSPCPEGGGVVLASGGSSGGRSFCLQPWSHLDASASACAGWLQAIGLDPSDLLLLNPLPPHHVSGLMPWWRSRCWGAAHAVLPPAWMKQPEQLMQACRGLGDWGRKPALVSLVPTQLQRLMAHPAGADWLQALAVVWVGGAALPRVVAEEARQRGIRLAPCYGATETAAMVAAQTPERFLRGESGCGAPLADVDLRVEVDGSLQVKTPRLAPLRWRHDHWAPLVDAQGWWRTGDAAELRDDAVSAPRLQLMGRMDGAIQSGGETVFPEQLSERLLEQAQARGLAVQAVLLLPVPSTEWGARLVALVRCADTPKTPDDWRLLLSRLQEITDGWLPAERPQTWQSCPDLDVSDAGKWQRARWQAWWHSQESAQSYRSDARAVRHGDQQ